MGVTSDSSLGQSKDKPMSLFMCHMGISSTLCSPWMAFTSIYIIIMLHFMETGNASHHENLHIKRCL